MSDPRFTKYGQRTNWHKPQPELDSPLFHGWIDIGPNEQGYTIFELGRAFMRTTTPEEKAGANCDWLVFIGPNVHGYNGSLAEITADVRRHLAQTEPYFLSNHIIPREAFGR